MMLGKDIRSRVFISLAVLLIFVSCTEVEHFSPDNDAPETDKLTFCSSDSDGWETIQTRSNSSNDLLSQVSIEYKDEIEGRKFILIMEEYDGIGSNDSVVVTKASEIPSDDALDMAVYSYITPKGEETEAPEYDGNKSTEFMINQFVDISEGYSYAPVKYWPGNGYWINFFAYRPYIRNINRGESPYLDIDSSDREPVMNYTVPKNVDHQVDLLAASVGTLSGDFRELVTFRFAHLLSAVKFKVGSVSATITEVALNNVALKGTGVKMREDGTWEKVEGIEDFIQSGLNVSGEDNPGSQIGKTFYMLPHKFIPEAELSITIRFEAPKDDPNHKYHEYTLTASLDEFRSGWEQGKTYVYTITTPEEIGLEVEEEFIPYDNVKENVHFVNTGLAASTIRAAIVGYWVVKSVDDGVENEYVIASWNPEVDGKFEGLPGEGWAKNDADGFYYYGPSVPSSEKTTNLFDSYTLTGNPPVAGAELVLTIVGQSVMTGYEGQSWSSGMVTSGN